MKQASTVLIGGGLSSRFITALLALLLCSALAADAPRKTTSAPRDVSLRHEVQHAIDRGLDWLLANQDAAGWWSTADQPAVTALALTAIQGEPSARFTKSPPPALKKGYDFLLSCAKPDGGIYQRDLANYNTATALMAFVAARGGEFDATARRARAYLVGTQVDLGEKGKLDSPFDGGIGYGSKYQHSDLNNTLLALEALHYSKRLVADKPTADSRDLDWGAAIAFLQHCQNDSNFNKQEWASDAPKNRGGFIYYPGQSMAGAETNSATGRVAFRSYGSASYAGLLSYIYADLKPADPRVTAVFDWLRANYTLDENPGMGAAGLYYYLHTMTKALTILGVDELELKDGRRVNWRKETALKLLNLQARDGSWANTHARWWEKDSALVTAYSVIALEMIHREFQ